MAALMCDTGSQMRRKCHGTDQAHDEELIRRPTAFPLLYKTFLMHIQVWFRFLARKKGGMLTFFIPARIMHARNILCKNVRACARARGKFRESVCGAF
jgi:hypothetical protein